MSTKAQRELAHRKKKRDNGLCVYGVCQDKLWRVGACYCLKHAVEHREKARQKRGSKRRMICGTYQHSVEHMKPYWETMSVKGGDYAKT